MPLHGEVAVFSARALASASVPVPAGSSAGCYLVQTLKKKECEERSFAARACNEISNLPGNPQVEWVRPLTRRLQRLFGWGDVISTRADVVRATKAGDTKELQALMPQAAHIVKHGELEHMPMLHDALRGNVPAREACEHTFFEEASRFMTKRRCSKDTAHCGPFTRCSS